MSAKLIIDMSRMKPQGQAAIRCSYKHHPENKGFDAVLEMVRFSLICRRCQSAPCVAACPRKALEKVPDGGSGDSILRRANMLCTGCGTCAIACPFGTVYDDLMPFSSSACDVCKGRLEQDEKPLCVRTCEDGSIDYGEAEPGGDLVEAAWGGTHPLLVLPAGAKETRALFQSAFGFQDVRYSPDLKALVAAEQGGRLWLLAEDGKPKAMLGDEAGTTAYRMSLQGGRIVVARMNRVVQVLSAR